MKDHSVACICVACFIVILVILGMLWMKRKKRLCFKTKPVTMPRKSQQADVILSLSSSVFYITDLSEENLSTVQPAYICHSYVTQSDKTSTLSSDSSHGYLELVPDPYELEQLPGISRESLTEEDDCKAESGENLVEKEDCHELLNEPKFQPGNVCDKIKMLQSKFNFILVNPAEAVKHKSDLKCENTVFSKTKTNNTPQVNRNAAMSPVKNKRDVGKILSNKSVLHDASDNMCCCSCNDNVLNKTIPSQCSSTLYEEHVVSNDYVRDSNDHHTDDDSNRDSDNSNTGDYMNDSNWVTFVDEDNVHDYVNCKMYGHRSNPANKNLSNCHHSDNKNNVSDSNFHHSDKNVSDSNCQDKDNENCNSVCNNTDVSFVDDSTCKINDNLLNPNDINCVNDSICHESGNYENSSICHESGNYENSSICHESGNYENDSLCPNNGNCVNNSFCQNNDESNYVNDSYSSFSDHDYVNCETID